MGKLFERIQRLVAADRYLISWHAGLRLEERDLLEWQIVESLSSGKLLSESARARPNPKVDVEQLLADGTEVKAVWSYLKNDDKALLVTVHFFD